MLLFHVQVWPPVLQKIDVAAREIRDDKLKAAIFICGSED
jgi:hypothetical protein